MINDLIKNIESAKDDPQHLREVLGKIMVYVNHMSDVYKNVRRSPNEQTVSQAKVLMNDIDSGVFDKLNSELKLIHDEYKTDPILFNLIETLSKSSFTPEQIKSLKSAISAGESTVTGFHSEVDQKGLDDHLKSSIYNTPNASDRTLKAIREMLQNAVDATDPKQHPELLHRKGYLPQIKITTKEHRNPEGVRVLDMIVEDHGTGMDWKTLSEKFLVLFQSGKQTDTGAAGGFGIAKALIQNTPEHGWSIDTNGIHSSRFHKNLYFGTLAHEYSHPYSQIKNTQDGATLSLFGLPYVANYAIEELCAVYGTNGRVAIILNNRNITPRFTIDSSDVTSFDSKNLGNLAKSVSKEGNTEAAEKILKKFKDDISQKIDDVADQATHTTTVKFLTRSCPYTGKLYVMVNGQYQFDENVWLNKLDVICYIETKARPSDSDYPLDPGRAYVRDPLGAKIRSVVNSIREFTDQVSKDDLFKSGIDAVMLNSEHEPMSTFSEKFSEKKDYLVDAISANLSATMHQSDEQRKASLEQLISQTLGKQSSTPEEHALVMQATKEIIEERQGRIDVDELDKIIENLLTPATVMVQKNFVASKWAKQNIQMTSNILILWQRVLRTVLDKLSSTPKFKRRIKSKNFIPGIIYSDECLGLYMPASPDHGRPYSSVSINPVTFAATVEPDLFNKKIAKIETEAFESVEQEDDQGQSTVADTPTNRLTKLLYFIATHELCHLLFPDVGGSHDEFHQNITYVELATHDCLDDIRNEVKQYMKELRRSSKSLINAVAKHKKKNENYLPQLESFHRFLAKKYTPSEVVTHIKVEAKNIQFKDWLAINN